MGNYENLKQSITEVIRTNGNQEITGTILQNVLLTIISSVGANATFAGIATPTTNPGTPDGPVFYLASESGTYANFNAIELQDGLSVLMWNGSWSSQQIFGIDDEPTVLSVNLSKSEGIYEKDVDLQRQINIASYGAEVDADNLILVQGKVLEEGLVYSASLHKYIKRPSGNFCIRNIAVESGTTYNVYCATCVQLDENFDYISHSEHNPMNQAQISMSANTKYVTLNYGSIIYTTYIGIPSYSRNNKKNYKNPRLLLTNENFRGFNRFYNDVESDAAYSRLRAIGLSIVDNKYIADNGTEASSNNFRHTNLFSVDLLDVFDIMLQGFQSSSVKLIIVLDNNKSVLGTIGGNIVESYILNKENLLKTYSQAAYLYINIHTNSILPNFLIRYGGVIAKLTETTNIPFRLEKGDSIFFNVHKGSSTKIALFARPTLGSYDNTVIIEEPVTCNGLYKYVAEQVFNEFRIIIDGSTDAYVEIIHNKATSNALDVLDAYNKTTPNINNNLPDYMILGRAIASQVLGNQLTTPLTNEPIGDSVLENTAGFLVYKDGYIYGKKNGNTIAYDHPESKDVYLFKYSIENEQIVKVVKVLAPNMTVAGLAIDRAYEGKIVLSGENIVLVNEVGSNNVGVLLSMTFDTNLDLVSSSVCNLVKDGDTVIFNETNLQSKGLAFSLPQYRGSGVVFGPGIAYYNGYHYGYFKVDEAWQYEGKNPVILLKSADLINFEYVDILNVRSQGEVGIDIKDGIMTLCIRPRESDYCGLLLLERIKLSTMQVIQKAFIDGTRSMGTFFRKDSKLYLLSPASDIGGYSAYGRRYYKISYISDYDLRDSQTIADTNGVEVGANTNVVIDEDGNLYACKTNKNIMICKFTLPDILSLRSTVYSIIENLLN